jgi:phage gp36-like protein
MPSDSTYADLEELYDRFTEPDIVRYSDETGLLAPTGDGPDLLREAYNGSAISTSDPDVEEAAEDAAESVKGSLRDAEAEINSRLQATYDVPLAGKTSNVPRIVVRIACDIGLFRLEENDPREVTESRYDRARSDLKALASGRMQLGVERDGDTREEGGSRAAATKGNATFSGGALGSWRQGGNAFG